MPLLSYKEFDVTKTSSKAASKLLSKKTTVYGDKSDFMYQKIY